MNRAYWPAIALLICGVLLIGLAFAVRPTGDTKTTTISTKNRTYSDVLADAYDYWEFAQYNTQEDGNGIIQAWTSTKRQLQFANMAGGVLTHTASPNGTMGLSGDGLVNPSVASWPSYNLFTKTLVFVCTGYMGWSCYVLNDWKNKPRMSVGVIADDDEVKYTSGYDEYRFNTAVSNGPFVISFSFRADMNQTITHINGVLVDTHSPYYYPNLAANTEIALLFGTIFFAGIWDVLLNDDDHARLSTYLHSVYVNALVPPAVSFSAQTYNAYIGTPMTLPLTNVGGAIQLPVTCTIDLSTLGLTLDTNTGEISGTPTQLYDNTFTITAANGTGSSSTNLRLIIHEAGADKPVFTYSPNSKIVAHAGYEISPHTVINTGITTPTEYSISPDLPNFLLFNTSTGTISGISTSVQNETTYTITGTNGASSGSTTITVEVVEAPPPTAPILSGQSASVVYYGYTITPITFTNTGGELMLSHPYTLVPDIHALTGLVFNTSTGAITGTPTALLAARTFTVTATGPAGSAQFVFSLQSALRHAVRYNPADLVFTVGTSVFQRPVYIDTVTNKVSATVPAYLRTARYAIDSSLAATGLSFNAQTGEISGTPRIATTKQSLTLEVRTQTMQYTSAFSTTCNGTFRFNDVHQATLSFAVGEPITLTPVISGKVIAMLTGESWPAFMHAFSNTFTVTGASATPVKPTLLDCNAYMADGTVFVCSQRIEIVATSSSTTEVFNPPILYSGVGLVGASGVALGVALLWLR